MYMAGWVSNYHAIAILKQQRVDHLKKKITHAIYQEDAWKLIQYLYHCHKVHLKAVGNLNVI